jgi:hypothetical protein
MVAEERSEALALGVARASWERAVEALHDVLVAQAALEEVVAVLGVEGEELEELAVDGVEDGIVARVTSDFDSWEVLHWRRL